MKTTAALILAALAVGLVAWDWFQQAKPPEPTLAIPTRETPMASHALQPFISSNHALTLVHVWATWCATCMAEMPSLLQVLSNLPNHIHAINISLDTMPEPLAAFYRKHNITPNQTTSPVWLHDATHTLTTNLMPNPKLPATFVFQRNGQLVQRVDGPLVWPAFINALPR